MPTMTPDHIRTELRAYLGRLAGQAGFTDGDDVFASGLVRSMNLLELVNHIEDTYGLRVGQRDVFEGHLRSVDRLVAFVCSRAGEVRR